MEVKKEEDKTIKTIVPIKGNLLEKLRNKLKQQNKVTAELSLNNNIHNGQKSSPIRNETKSENKVIIQKVEKVQMDIASIMLHHDAIAQANTISIPENNKEEAALSEKVQMKILSAKLPENDFNKVLPLKMIRTIKAPKPVPNVQRKRYGNVQIHQSTSTPVISVQTVAKINEAIQQPQQLSSVEIEIFKGFDDNDKCETFVDKLEFWRQLLSMDDYALNTLLEESRLTEHNNCAFESQTITDSMVDSSMMREFAKDLDTTTVPPTPGDMSSIDTEDTDMEDSSEDQSGASDMDADQAQWLMDIDDLIGETRIREIDQSLKKIPSIVTGNRIQTENVELKLIINHLLKKLNAQSVVETMNISNDIEDTAEHFSDADDHTHFDDTEIPETKIEDIQAPVIVKEDHTEITLPDVKDVTEEAPSTSENVEIICEKVETTKDSFSRSSRKRKNEIFPIATSTVKKMKPEPGFHPAVYLEHPSSSSQAETKTVNANSRTRRGRSRLKAELESVEIVVEEKLQANEVKRVLRRRNEVFVEKARSLTPPPPSSSPLEIQEKELPPRRYSKLVSEEHEVVSENLICKPELKSSNDLNSLESAVIIYHDYLNTPSSPLDTRKREGIVEASVIEKVSEAIEKQKSTDPTFRQPRQRVKRPYLRTSAFKGNQDDNNIIQESVEYDSSSNETPENSDSVLNDPANVEQSVNDPANVEQSVNDPANVEESGNIEEAQPNISLKELMNSLIAGKETFIDTKNKKPKVPNKVKKKETPKREPKKKALREYKTVPKKVFEQEPLERADEAKVPYESIIESIRISNPPRSNKSGKAVWTGMKFDSQEKKSLHNKLKKLKHFRCGTCKFLVTKHKWKQHLESHGVFTYIEDFETPLNISDWNESLRRIIQYCKIYKIDILTCPNCESVKKSPLGQMCHIFVCGEEAETLESRKLLCEFCNTRVLPFSMSMHKKTCKGLQVVADKDIINSSASESEESVVYNTSGRAKRKAVQRAEKKFKTILNKLSDDRDEHVKALNENGEFQCNLCGQNFSNKEITLEHVESEHNVQKGIDDFGSSSSDEYGEKGDESSETDDGSSGVDENDERNTDNSEDDDNSNVVSFANSGRKMLYETNEIKFARIVLQEYAEEIRQKKLTTKIIELSQQAIRNNLGEEIFPDFTTKYQIISHDLISFVNQIDFRRKSIHFLSNQVDRYLKDFQASNVKSEWKQLNVGTRDSSDCQHVLIYCGGSVSSTDWAPIYDKGDVNFLAVACNVNNDALKLGLKQTIKSCVQIYEFKSLVNEKFQNFKNITSKLLYTFEISDGPIWCVKFHPYGHLTGKRIGVLAVTTAQQDVLIFSLPYLNCNNDNKPSAVVKLEPNIICRLANEVMLYQDNFLLQTTRVCWHFQKDLVNILAAGYVNGYVAIWNLSETDDGDALRFPDIVIQAHREAVTAVDIKAGEHGKFFLLTATLGREIRLYSIEGCRYEELTVSQLPSRSLCAQLWSHWSGFLYGNDNAYALGCLNNKQPFDFGRKNTTLMNVGQTIINMDINHWTNTVLFSTDSGDVLSATPHQLVSTDPKDRWRAFENTIISFTDFKRIPQQKGVPDEIGIIFNDLKANADKKPKSFRVAPAELTNQLQVNHIRFNPNEKSHRFYALGYETGFVRIRKMKN